MCLQPDAGRWYGDSLELLGNDLGDTERSPRFSTVPVNGCGFCAHGDSLWDE